MIKKVFQHAPNDNKGIFFFLIGGSMDFRASLVAQTITCL